MKRLDCFVVPVLLLAGGALVRAEVVKGVMAINGAEMTWWGGTARDAIARQVDVQEDTVKLHCESGEETYRPGKITFHAKEGHSINLGKIQESITATRLSGNTNMRVHFVEIEVRGNLRLRDGDPQLEVSGAEQVFELAADDRDLEKRLLEAASGSRQAVTVVGRVDGWSGRFPVVLRTLAKRYGIDGKKPMLLVITRLDTAENN